MIFKQETRDILFLRQSRNIYNMFFSYLDMAQPPQTNPAQPKQTNPASGQQGMARQTISPQQTNTAKPNPAVVQQNQPPEDGKKSKLWIWILVAVVVIGISIGSYFLFFT